MWASDDPDHDTVEDPRGAGDHVEMAVRHGVVRAGTDGGDHSASKIVMRACPYLRLVRSVSGSSGPTRAAVSTTARPSDPGTAGRERGGRCWGAGKISAWGAAQPGSERPGRP